MEQEQKKIIPGISYRLFLIISALYVIVISWLGFDNNGTRSEVRKLQDSIEILNLNATLNDVRQQVGGVPVDSIVKGNGDTVIIYFSPEEPPTIYGDTLKVNHK